MTRTLKHDPSKAKFIIRWVGKPSEIEVRHLQTWSLQQFATNALNALTKRQGVQS